MPPVLTAGALSAKDIAGYAAGAGFSGAALETAVAVGLAESSGRPNAVGDLTLQTAEWGPSIGIWQIRSRKAEKGKGTARDADRLTEPGFNARSAYAISNGGANWSPWSVYKSGAYRLYLLQAKKGVKDNGGRAIATARTNPAATGTLDAIAQGLHAVPGVDEAAAVVDTASALTDLAQYPARVTAWLSDRNNIIRILKVVTGVGLLVAGLVVVSRPAVTRAASVALGATGAGKAAKAAGSAAGASGTQ